MVVQDLSEKVGYKKDDAVKGSVMKKAGGDADLRWRAENVPTMYFSLVGDVGQRRCSVPRSHRLSGFDS